jgi:hypothetical protein
MKRIITSLLLLVSWASYAGPKTFDKLASLNAVWKEQPAAIISSLPEYGNLSETAWIQTHLSLVERTLRSKSTAHLSASQRANRAAALQHLHEYWNKGAFPQNEDYGTRLPIFIDKHDNFCAVGYLVKATGYEAVSRKVQANTNLAYVRDMQYPELNQWAADYGFTTDELAWIQPTYPPTHHGEGVGKGVNGTVHEMLADDAEGRLYVGGSFSMADSSVAASNIAYVTEAGGVYTWHNMGDGLNGPVYAIAKHNNMIFAAGAFTMSGSTAVNNVAWWDGSQWQGAGCLYGTVKDLMVHGGDLYAVGDFDVCAALMEVNFARWSDPMWQQIPGLEGHINTMASTDTSIVLGGAFTFPVQDMDALNIISWSELNGFHTYDMATTNEVMDFEWFSDTLYAACNHTSPLEDKLLLCLRGAGWANSTYDFVASPDVHGFNSLCAKEDTLHIGGLFDYPLLMTFNKNLLNVTTGVWWADDYFLTDSTVYKVERFNGQLYVGGAFTKEGPWSTNMLNGIAVKKLAATNVPVATPGAATLAIYPNPATTSLSIHAGFTPAAIRIHDIAGRLVFEQELKASASTVSLPSLPSGVYTAAVSSATGQKAVEKLVIE